MKRITLNNLPVHSKKSLLLTVIMLTVVLISTGSVMIPEDMQKDQPSDDKKLRLLEMLERGEKLSAEEIRSSFTDDQFCIEPFIPMQGEFNGMMIDLGKEMEELGRNFEDFNNSMEFKNELERLSRERERLKIDLEKVREEVKRAIKEIRESGFDIEKG
jgi:hypothetical protein